VDLPGLFEQAIQESEVKKQDIQKALAELNKVKIEIDTLKKSAEYQKNVTINLASGEAESLLKQNDANIKSLTKVQNAQSEAYSTMKTKLKMPNNVLLNFIKAKLIKNYNGKNLAMNILSPDL
jgi:chaperonin cofactor prefoldin